MRVHDALNTLSLGPNVISNQNAQNAHTVKGRSHCERGTVKLKTPPREAASVIRGRYYQVGGSTRCRQQQSMMTTIAALTRHHPPTHPRQRSDPTPAPAAGRPSYALCGL